MLSDVKHPITNQVHKDIYILHWVGAYMLIS